MSLGTLFSRLKGSSASGNYGHTGRKGKRGGSAPSFANSIMNYSFAKDIVEGRLDPENSRTDEHKAIMEIALLRGFDKNPKVVNAFVEEPGDIVIYRGFGTEKSHLEQFKNGDYFIGGGLSGTGTYTATDIDIARSYDGGSGFLKMKLPKGAKVIDERVIDDMRRNTKPQYMLKADKMKEKAFKLHSEGKEDEANNLFRKAMDIKPDFPRGKVMRILSEDRGIFAIAKGYDAIRLENGNVLVLNRSILEVESEPYHR